MLLMVGTARCAVPAAERSVRRRNELPRPYDFARHRQQHRDARAPLRRLPKPRQGGDICRTAIPKYICFQLRQERHPLGQTMLRADPAVACPPGTSGSGGRAGARTCSRLWANGQSRCRRWIALGENGVRQIFGHKPPSHSGVTLKTISMAKPPF
jgi:hypothetical protein